MCKCESARKLCNFIKMMVPTIPSFSKPTNTITISNIETNTIVHHPIIILKGTVKHINCGKETPTDLTVISQNGANEKCFKTKLLSDEFKFLIELTAGDNNIILNHCCTFASLSITYVRRKSNLNIVPIYIVNEGHSGKFQAPKSETNTPANACQRIMTGCKLLQCFVAEKLHEDGLTRKTFQLDSDECLIFNSKLRFEDARNMKQDELWAHLGREVMNSEIGDSDKKYLGFLSCTTYDGEKYTDEVSTHEGVVALTESYVALGGGGLALFGSACLYTWPENVGQVISRFEDQGIVDKRKFMDDSCYRGTVGGCFSTTLGSVLHELCHTFDLGHTKDGIMGRGFDNIYKFFVLGPENAIKKPLRQKTRCSGVTITINEKVSNGVIRNPKAIDKIIGKANNEDEAYFTRSCASLLHYHQYLNDYVSNRDYVLHFDESTKLLKSTAGIRVIEIRNCLNEMVRENWTFVGKVLKYSFQIPEHCFIDDSFMLIAMDNRGNMLKETFAK